jgi:hypothetical protein
MCSRGSLQILLLEKYEVPESTGLLNPVTCLFDQSGSIFVFVVGHRFLIGAFSQ